MEFQLNTHSPSGPQKNLDDACIRQKLSNCWRYLWHPVWTSWHSLRLLFLSKITSRKDSQLCRRAGCCAHSSNPLTSRYRIKASKSNKRASLLNAFIFGIRVSRPSHHGMYLDLSNAQFHRIPTYLNLESSSEAVM